jgi:ubiquinone/menaquinone biosynthesis C-methylase UbiE
MPAAVTSYTLEDQERMARAANYFAWQHRLVTRELGQRVIEIGCGIGNFTRLMLDREAVLAVDAESDCIARLQQRFPDRPNLSAVACDVMAPQFGDLQSFRADSCVCLNVLEHIEHDREALGRMADVLIPGGILILLVAASPSLYGRIDELLGHHRRYTRASMSRIAEEAGLVVNTAYYLNAFGFFGWWTNSHILKRDTQSPAQIKFFDRYVVPVVSRVESILHPPFGQSLFVVLKKTS